MRKDVRHLHTAMTCTYRCMRGLKLLVYAALALSYWCMRRCVYSNDLPEHLDTRDACTHLQALFYKLLVY
jgi:hypothetical protein